MINFGTMIRELRERAGLGANEIARGIVSAAELSKLESGENHADYIVWEALFERMGKSIDKLEPTVSGNYYTVLLLQEGIEKSLAERDYEAVHMYLEAYGQYSDAERGIHRQYRLMAEAVCQLLERGEAESTREKLETAIILTFPEWKNRAWGENRLCIQELRLLCLIAYVKMVQKGGVLRRDMPCLAECHTLLRQLREYVRNHLPDGEARVKIYPQILFLLGRVQLTLGDTKKAYGSAEEGIRCLSENGVLIMMEKLLELKEKCLEKENRTAEMAQCARYREAIRYLYDTAEMQPEREMAAILMQGSCQKEYMVSNEMLRELRMARGVTQEALSEDICAQETLARIETGKSNPNKKNFRKLMEKLGARGSLFYGYIVSEHYEPYEWVRLFNRCNVRVKEGYEKAERLLAEIEEALDLSIAENRQYTEWARMRFQYADGELTDEAALQKCRELLELTMPPIEGKPLIYRMPHRMEAFLLNQMALCHKHCKRVQEALDIYEEILDRYERSVTLMKHHAVPLFLIYGNYPATLEVHDELEKSCQMAKVGLRHSLCCGRGDTTVLILANLSCVYEKWHKPKLAKEDLYHTIALADLYHDVEAVEICRKEYAKY